jgi:DNA-binding MarR family transcriptional regulator
MKHDNIRRFIAKDISLVKKFMIPRQAWEVLQYMKQHHPRNFRSNEIADEFDLSIQHASNLMRTLCRKGYIGRRIYCTSSSGIEFEFRLRLIF